MDLGHVIEMGLYLGNHEILVPRGDTTNWDMGYGKSDRRNKCATDARSLPGTVGNSPDVRQKGRRGTIRDEWSKYKMNLKGPHC